MAKLVRSPIFWIVVITLTVGLPVVLRSYRGANPKVGAPLSEVPAFALTDQNGQPFTRESLLGQVTLVNFIFTSGPDVCPLLPQQMRKVQQKLKAEGRPYRLVSISVDPDTDTPAVLKDYAEKHGADTSNWSFVTGPLDDIQKVVIEGFKVGLDRGETPKDQISKLDPNDLTSLMDITHGEQFVVVDADARIRAYRTAHNGPQVDELVALAKAVEK
jgi:protein SCO1/2